MINGRQRPWTQWFVGSLKFLVGSFMLWASTVRNALSSPNGVGSFGTLGDARWERVEVSRTVRRRRQGPYGIASQARQEMVVVSSHGKLAHRTCTATDGIYVSNLIYWWCSHGPEPTVTCAHPD